MKKILVKPKAFYSSLFFSLLFVSSCCIFKTDTPELRITSQNFPSTVNANQRFDLFFTVGNFSTGDCDAETTSQSIVNLKMTNRATGVVQVNDNETLNELSDNSTQNFDFSVIIGPEGIGTYDMVFTVDPNNTSGSVNTANNTVTGTIVVQ